jgi:hypothetical protein
MTLRTPTRQHRRSAACRRETSAPPLSPNNLPTDDLALRHAASQALSRFVEGAAAATAAAAAAAGDAAAAPEGGALLSAAQRVLFPQLKRGLPAAALAVRQEHLALLRQLVRSFPFQYPDLVQLTGGWLGPLGTLIGHAMLTFVAASSTLYRGWAYCGLRRHCQAGLCGCALPSTRACSLTHMPPPPQPRSQTPTSRWTSC